MQHKVLQVRDVPEDVHRKLKIRAAQEGRTLSELLREELVRVAERPTRREVLERIAALEPVALDEPPAETVRRMRDGAA